MVLVAVVEFFSRSLLSAHSSRQLLVPMFHYHRPNQHFSTIIYPLSLLISKLHFCSCRTSYNLKLMLLQVLEMKTNYFDFDFVMMMKLVKEDGLRLYMKPFRIINVMVLVDGFI